MRFLKHFLVLIALCASLSAQTIQPVAIINGPTVTASSAYSSGMCVGGVFSFVKPVSADGGTSTLQSIRLWDSDYQIPNLTLLLFNANPVTDGWTLTDHSAVVAPASLTEIPAVISILSSDWLSVSTAGVITINDVNMPTDSALGQSRTVYGVFMTTTSTPTFTGTASLKIKAFFNLRP